MYTQNTAMATKAPIDFLLPDVLSSAEFSQEEVDSDLEGLTLRFLREEGTSLFGAIISVVLILATSMTHSLMDAHIPAYVIGASELGLVLLVWWHYKLELRFHQRIKQKQLGDLEAENQLLQDLSDRQAKIIHTDTKIVSAMGSSLKGVMDSAAYPTPEARQRATDLLDYLDAAAQKRDKLLFENQKANVLPETGVAAVDSMIGYLHGRASAEGITFTFGKLASVRHMTQTVISEDDLTILLGDLLTNAIIAERTTHMKNLMLVVRVEGAGYVIEVSDSGEPFAPEVIAKLGRERITTHADSGGSGYGMVTIFEILDRTAASFVLKELEDGPYTKKLSICLDGRSQIRIKSKRPAILAIRDAREDIIWL